MRELINYCSGCGKAIYCENGFFTGVMLEDGKVVCFDCDEKKKNPKENENFS